MGRWAMYFQLMVLGIVLCMIALIALAVPYIFDHWRRWREQCRMDAMMRDRDNRAMSPDAARRAERLVGAKKEIAAQDALGWQEDETPEDGMPGLDETRTPPRDRGKNILVADDDPVVLLALSRRLQHLGFRVMRSPDATHALLQFCVELADFLFHPLALGDVALGGGNTNWFSGIIQNFRHRVHGLAPTLRLLHFQPGFPSLVLSVVAMAPSFGGAQFRTTRTLDYSITPNRPVEDAAQPQLALLQLVLQSLAFRGVFRRQCRVDEFTVGVHQTRLRREPKEA